MKKIKSFNNYFNKLNENLEDSYNENELEEDVAVEYVGDKMMKDLSEKLGVDIVDNSIDYNGKIINYFSETEKFHIGNMKFDDVDSVYEYLTSEEE